MTTNSQTYCNFSFSSLLVTKRGILYASQRKSRSRFHWTKVYRQGSPRRCCLHSPNRSRARQPPARRPPARFLPLAHSRSRHLRMPPPARASSSPSLSLGFFTTTDAAAPQQQQPLSAISSPAAAPLSSSLPPASTVAATATSSAASLAAAARKNSAGDLADPPAVSSSPGYATVSEARLLYRNWRTGSHVGADLHHLHDEQVGASRERRERRVIVRHAMVVAACLTHLCVCVCVCGGGMGDRSLAQSAADMSEVYVCHMIDSLTAPGG